MREPEKVLEGWKQHVKGKEPAQKGLAQNPSEEIITQLETYFSSLQSLPAKEKTSYTGDYIIPLLVKLKPLEREEYERKLKSELGIRLSVIREAVRDSVPKAPSTPEEIPAEVIEQGRDFALSIPDDPLESVAETVRRSGVSGENNNVKLLYLALTSRLLEKPVSIAVKGVSSGGKSFTVEKVMELFPKQAYLARTGLSPRALAYTEEDFQHRTLIIFEAAGLGEEGDYLLRSLLSEGRLLYETVESTSAGLKSKIIEKEGPTNCVLTTTKISLHPENETRLLSLSVNDSKEQTKAVLKRTANRPTGIDLTPWRAFQSYLTSESHEVVIPYAEALAEAIPPVAVRLRRDFSALLSLIKTHAIICGAHREQDQEGQIIATLDDYEVVRALVLPIISEGVQATVKQTIRETVEAVAKLALCGGTTTLRALAEELTIDKSPAARRAREAIAAGYLANEEERRGKPAKYKLGEPMPEDLEILPQKSFFCVSGSDTRATLPQSGKTPSEDGQGLWQTPLPHPCHSAEGVTPWQDCGNPQSHTSEQENGSSEPVTQEVWHCGTEIPGTDTEENISDEDLSKLTPEELKARGLEVSLF